MLRHCNTKVETIKKDVDETTQTLSEFLFDRCPSLHNKYNAPFLLQISPMLHTILAQKCHVPHANIPTINRQHIVVESGGNVAIDWLDHLPKNPSMVVIGFPGAGNCQIASGLTSTLICALHEIIGNEVAFGVAVYQGLGGLRLSSHKIPGSGYCATDDVYAILKAVREKFAKPIPLLVVASSFGTALFSNYAARNQDEIVALGVTGAIFLAFGHSMLDTRQACDTGIISKFVIKSWIKHLTDDEGKIIESLEKQFPSLYLNALLKSTTFEEWDLATLPLYGYATLEDLYAAADPVGFISHMPMPTLFLNSEDDPICPAKRLNVIDYEQPHFAVFSTKHGGHLGWFEKIPCGQSHVAIHSPWLLRVVSEFVKCIPEYRRTDSV